MGFKIMGRVWEKLGQGLSSGLAVHGEKLGQGFSDGMKYIALGMLSIAIAFFASALLPIYYPPKTKTYESTES